MSSSKDCVPRDLLSRWLVPTELNGGEMGHSARRRADLERMKAKARKVKHWHDMPEKFANHLKGCSCIGCGNPRKFFGELTIQERKFLNP